jgi:hypothetical protein
MYFPSRTCDLQLGAINIPNLLRPFTDAGVFGDVLRNVTGIHFEAFSVIGKAGVRHRIRHVSRTDVIKLGSKFNPGNDAWSVPQRLQTLAELQVSQGKYADAKATYDRAGAFVDSMIGTFPSVLDKTALIRASSELYSEHLRLRRDQQGTSGGA